MEVRIGSEVAGVPGGGVDGEQVVAGAISEPRVPVSVEPFLGDVRGVQAFDLCFSMIFGCLAGWVVANDLGEGEKRRSSGDPHRCDHSQRPIRQRCGFTSGEADGPDLLMFVHLADERHTIAFDGRIGGTGRSGQWAPGAVDLDEPELGEALVPLVGRDRNDSCTTGRGNRCAHSRQVPEVFGCDGAWHPGSLSFDHSR